MIVTSRRVFGSTFGDLDPSQLVPSRTEMRSETDALLAAIKQLAQDEFNGSDSLTQDQLTAWNSFINEVENWDAGPDLLAHTLVKNWLNDLVGYQKQFNQFLGEWQQAGVATSLPPFTFSSHPSVIDSVVGAGKSIVDDAKNAAKSALTTIEVVGIVGGATVVGLIVYLIWESGRSVRALGPSALKVL